MASTGMAGDERAKRLRIARVSAPAQHSTEWYQLRFGSSNSSQYRSIFNVDGTRDVELALAAARQGADHSLAMSWGTLMENVSGYLFSAETGLSFEEIGSLPHPSYPRIRGSVDGFGVDGDGCLFALETKTPFSRVPTAAISDVTYIYQMIQNVEIIDADYALFNDVRLLPCATEDLYDESACRDPDSGMLLFARYAKHGLARQQAGKQVGKQARSGVRMVATAVTVNDPSLAALAHIDPASLPHSRFSPSAAAAAAAADAADAADEEYVIEGSETLTYEAEKDKRIDGEWYGNVFDALTDHHSRWTRDDLHQRLLTYSIAFRPIGHTFAAADASDGEWIERMYSVASQDRDAIGIAFFRVDVHNVQRVERATSFWHSVLRPRALQWIADIDAVRAGHKPSLVPTIAHYDLPLPPSSHA